MSRWILQSAASDSDPISFEQLAQMLADGVVEEMDLVRPEQSTHWQPVDGVVGLCRAADRLRRTSSPDGVAALEMLADGTDSDGIQGDAADSLSAEILPLAGEVGTPEKLSILVSWKRVLTLSVVMGFIGFVGWHFWMDGRRFPRPAHLAANAQPRTLPWLGQVNEFELAMLAFDAVAIMAFVVWWFRTKRPAG